MLPALFGEDGAFILVGAKKVCFIFYFHHTIAYCASYIACVSFYLTLRDILCCITGLFLMFLFSSLFSGLQVPCPSHWKLGPNGLTGIPSCCTTCQHSRRSLRPHFRHASVQNASVQSAHPWMLIHIQHVDILFLMWILFNFQLVDSYFFNVDIC